MTTAGLTADQLDDYKSAFDLFDANNDGRIEYSELADMTRKLNQKMTDEAIKKMMDSADLDGNGTIDFNEFVVLMQKFSPPDRGYAEQLREAFQVFDEDGNGTITAEELKHVMVTTMGEVMTEQDVEDLIREIDLDGDGIIDYEEFVTLMSDRQ